MYIRLKISCAKLRSFPISQKACYLKKVKKYNCLLTMRKFCINLKSATGLIYRGQRVYKRLFTTISTGLEPNYSFVISSIGNSVHSEMISLGHGIDIDNGLFKDR